MQDTANSLIESAQSAASAAKVAVVGAGLPKEPDDWCKANEVEHIAEDEEAKIDKISELVKDMMQRNFDSHQHFYRGTHVKSLAFVRGTLTVNPDLPSHLQHGIFRPGATYPVIARYANEPSFILPDYQKAPRGLGLKVFGVEGARLEGAGEGKTQDFLFNNAPMVELTDVDTTLEIFELRTKYYDSPAKLQLALAARSDRVKQFAPGLLPNTYVVGNTFFTQSSFAFGPHVSHLSLTPATDLQKSLRSETIPSDADATFHRKSLHDHFASDPARYTFRAQFASDVNRHPVEDASVEWDENTAPWHDLAIVEFPAQACFSDDRRIWWEEKIALTPWNGLVEHRPLGSINRLRKRVYENGRNRRMERNKTELYFPLSADDMPG